MGKVVDEKLGAGGFELGACTVAVGDAAGVHMGTLSHLDVVDGVAHDECFVSLETPLTERQEHRFGVRLGVFHVVGTQNQTDVGRDAKAFDQQRKRVATATAGNGERLSAPVKLAYRVDHVRKGGHRTGMIVPIENAAVGFGTAFAHLLVYRGQVDEGFFEGKSDGGGTVGLVFEGQMEGSKCLLQCLDNEGARIAQRSVEI